MRLRHGQLSRIKTAVLFSNEPAAMGENLINYNIIEEPIAHLAGYAQIPMYFEVVSVFDIVVDNRGLGGLVLLERRLDEPWTKDYDAIDGEGPTEWAKRWDVSNWGLLSAFCDGERIGGCALAYDTNGVNMLEGRKDMVVLWDLRVHPDYRGQGVGSQLWETAVSWAKARKCRLLKVETQNINVPACRFYARQGCELGEINRFAYTDFPDEVQLIWYLQLDDPAEKGDK